MSNTVSHNSIVSDINHNFGKTNFFYESAVEK